MNFQISTLIIYKWKLSTMSTTFILKMGRRLKRNCSEVSQNEFTKIRNKPQKEHLTFYLFKTQCCQKYFPENCKPKWKIEISGLLLRQKKNVQKN